MVLENFLIDVDVLWDRAGKELYEKPQARAGRKMRVRVKNKGLVEDLTGYTLNLGWKSTIDETKFGLDAFTAVDITKGIFEIAYTSGMLTNIGMLVGTLQLVPSVGNATESNNFMITVKKSAVDAAAVQSETSFTALASALVSVNDWNARIDAVEADFIQRANDMEAIYPQQLLSLGSQLAETTADLNKTTDLTFENIARNFTVKPNDKVNTQKVYMTIIDDDGRTEVWDKLKPISEDLEVPITIAVPVRNTETTPDKDLTRDQLLYLQDELGWEMASHSWTHGNLRNFTAEQIEYELRGSKEELISWGLDIKNFVAPYGTNDSTLVREIASKYYNCGARVGGGINRNPVKNQYLNRVSLGSFAGTNNTLDYYKSGVDKAIDSNGWIIFMTHCWHSDHDATQNQYLRDTILYAQSKGVEIVNLQDGFEKMGNIFEIEDYFSIAKNGFLYGNSAGIHCTDEGQIKVSQIPSDFYKLYRDKVVVSNLRATDNQQFPENNSGTLLTFIVGGPDTIWQQWHPHRRYSTYRRYSIDTGGTAWSAWERTPVFKKMEIIDPVERTIPAGKALVFILLTDEDINGDVINITPNLSYGEIMWSASHSGGKTLIVTLFNTHSAPLTVSNVKYDINIVKS